MTPRVTGQLAGASGIRSRLPVALGIATRLGWGLADQALSSATNFVLGVLVARSFGVLEFGAFSLAFATYNVAAAASRAVTAQPLVVRNSAVEHDIWREATARAAGTAFVLGVIVGAGCLAVAAAASGPLREAFLALGIMLPGLMVQDLWRFALFADGRGRAGFTNDLVWAAVQFPLLILVIAVGHGTILLATAAWGGAALIAALFGVAQTRVVPRPTGARAWLSEHRSLASRYLAEAGAYTVAGQLLLYAIGFVAGLAAVGEIRAAQLILGPLNVVLQGLILVAVPEAAAMLRRSPGRLRVLCLIAALSLGSVTLIWTGLILVFPEPAGRALLRSAWPAAHSLALPWGLSFAAINVGAGALIGLRALAAAGRNLRAAVVTSAVAFVSGVAGAALGGAAGAAWAVAIANTTGIAVWWWEFRRGLREYVEPPPAPPAGRRGSISEAAMASGR
ncbi:MAG TPA: hypothetical protein VF763_12070 [Candidatus Limnocylindrales bacterium]